MENLKKLYARLDAWILHKQPVRFAIVGGIAFTVNILLLFLIHGVLNAYLLVAQVIAAEGTIVTSFLLHHHWTYKNYSEKSWRIRFFHFNSSSLGGTLIANGTLLICVHIFKINYLYGFSVGAVLALTWNYFANKRFIWRL
ncbi:hypothetical protein BH10PAT3_BH10PAT3_3990 [soil metagenome]